MANPEFRYDVAFSFHSSDEAVAREINDLISDRLTTFYYAERQREIGGTNGEDSFGRVFGEEARIVVILYRKEWGTTSWTRVEETAIKNRAMTRDGYDFVILVPTVKGVEPPKWLPRNRLWVDLERWGAPGAASVIEARAAELGSIVKQETILERESRMRRNLAAAEARRQFHESHEGPRVAKEQFQLLAAEIERHVAEIVANGCPIPLKTQMDGENCILVTGAKAGLRVAWNGRFANTLRDSELKIEITDGPPRISTGWYMDPPRPSRRTETLLPVGGDDLGFRWIRRGRRDDPTLSNALVSDMALTAMLEHAEAAALESDPAGRLYRPR